MLSYIYTYIFYISSSLNRSIYSIDATNANTPILLAERQTVSHSRQSSVSLGRLNHAQVPLPRTRTALHACLLVALITIEIQA
jgi:hypothetical protein